MSRHRHSQVLPGARFTRLTVVSEVPRGERSRPGYRMWTCVCDCGETCEAVTGDLNAGRKRSCGCLLRDAHAAHAWFYLRPASFTQDERDRHARISKRAALARRVARMQAPEKPETLVERLRRGARGLRESYYNGLPFVSAFSGGSVRWTHQGYARPLDFER